MTIAAPGTFHKSLAGKYSPNFDGYLPVLYIVYWRVLYFLDPSDGEVKGFGQIPVVKICDNLPVVAF